MGSVKDTKATIEFLITLLAGKRGCRGGRSCRPVPFGSSLGRNMFTRHTWGAPPLRRPPVVHKGLESNLIGYTDLSHGSIVLVRQEDLRDGCHRVPGEDWQFLLMTRSPSLYPAADPATQPLQRLVRSRCHGHHPPRMQGWSTEAWARPQTQGPKKHYRWERDGTT